MNVYYTDDLYKRYGFVSLLCRANSKEEAIGKFNLKLFTGEFAYYRDEIIPLNKDNIHELKDEEVIEFEYVE